MELSVEQLVAVGPVIPVVQIHDASQAPALAQALLAGGIKVIEITLRTPSALEAIARVAGECPEMIVGAGTVCLPNDLHAAHRAGARFVVSPGLNAAISEQARQIAMPLLPGAVTASELMSAMSLGHRVLKFFPAASSGGASAIAAFASPFASLTFCPTGGVTPANANDYLSLANVACVGGSWLAPAALVQAQRWDEITALARAASRLGATDQPS